MATAADHSFSARGTGVRSLMLAIAVTGVASIATVTVGHAQQGDAPPAAETSPTSGPVVLDRITVGGDRTGVPDDGVVAKRSTTATKTNTEILETPQAINVITRKQMNQQDAHSVSDALRYTPGIMSEANGFDTRYDWIWIRGFNTYGMMWLDGLVIAGDPNNYATPSIHPYALERVEVVKGPASVLYGRTIPGGIVNQVSKRPQKTASHEVLAASTGYGGIQGALDSTGPITENGELSYRVTGLVQDINTQINMERSRKVMLQASLAWNPSADTSLAAYGYYQLDRDVFSPRFYPAYGTLLPNPAGQIPRGIYLSDTNAPEFNREFYAVGYDFSHRFGDTLSLRQHLRYSFADQNMFLALVNPAFAYAGAPSGILNRAAAISADSTSTLSVDTQAEVRLQTGAASHAVLLGVDYVNGMSDTNFGNTAPGNPTPPPVNFLNPSYGHFVPMPAYQRSALQRQNQIGFYVQDQIRYDRWIGTFGLRYDLSSLNTVDRIGGTPAVTTSDNKVTWRAGLTYLFENGIAPYASYTTSFLPILGTNRQGSPFSAQTAEQFEIGVKYEPRNGLGLFTLSLFSLTANNGLTPDPVDARFNVQTGKQRVEGIEVEGKYRVTPETDVMLAYAFSKSKVLNSTTATALGREMLRLPEHQGSFWINHRTSFWPGFSVRAGVRAMSSYQTDPTYLELLRIPARALIDIGAEYDLGTLRSSFEGIRLQVSASNLTDQTYVSHCLNLTGGSCNYGEGRSVWATLKYSW